MSEPVTVTDADRAKATEVARSLNYPGLLTFDGRVDRIAAALADARAEADQLRDAMRALAEEWRYKGEFGWGPWQEGQGPDIEGAIRDECAARVRDLADGGRR